MTEPQTAPDRDGRSPDVVLTDVSDVIATITLEPARPMNAITLEFGTRLHLMLEECAAKARVIGIGEAAETPARVEISTNSSVCARPVVSRWSRCLRISWAPATRLLS